MDHPATPTLSDTLFDRHRSHGSDHRIRERDNIPWSLQIIKKSWSLGAMELGWKAMPPIYSGKTGVLQPNGDFSPTHFHSPPPPLEKSFSASPKAPEMISKSAIPHGMCRKAWVYFLEAIEPASQWNTVAMNRDDVPKPEMFPQVPAKFDLKSIIPD